MQQFGEPLAFVRLGEFVRGPILLVGDASGLDFLERGGNGRGAVARYLDAVRDFAAYRKLDRVDVLALALTESVIGAGTPGCRALQIDGVGVIAHLRRDDPERAILP